MVTRRVVVSFRKRIQFKCLCYKVSALLRVLVCTASVRHVKPVNFPFHELLASCIWRRPDGPIVQAVQNGSVSILKLLVAVPGNFSRDDARRGLVLAVSNGDADSVDVLLRAGLCADTVDFEDVPVLSRAATAGHVAVIRCLLAAGCSVDRRCRDSTALHRCVVNGHTDCLVALIEAGADINTTDSTSCTPLILAAKQCHRSMKAMKCLIEAGCNMEHHDTNKRTALHYASYRAVGVEMLLSAGAKPDPKDADGNAPIHLASIEGFDTIVRCLVTFNCDPNIVNDTGKMAVHYLAMKGHWRAIDDIVRVGGYLDHVDNDGNVPLWYAIEHNRTDAVRTLLMANCEPHPNGCRGGIPLESALRQHHYILAQWLLLAGACLHPLLTHLTENEQHPARQQPGVMQDDDVLTWLTAWARHPHTLRHQCRNVLRSELRRKQPLLKQVEGLGVLPPAVHSFICLRELEDRVNWSVALDD